MNMYEKILLIWWKFVKKMDAKRMAKQTEPEHITVHSDIPYIVDGKTPNYLDIYYPEGTDKPLPVIIVVHGGGWLYGNKELNKNYAMNLALRGFAVVNINYHLVQEERYPKQLQDIYAMLEWLYLNGKNYYCDIDNVFITGDSAGAHLSSIALALQHNDEMKKLLNIDTNLNIKAGAMICGVYDLDEFGWFKSLITRPYAKVLLGVKPHLSEYGKLISFKGSFNGKIAPLYLMTSQDDFVKDQTRSFAKYCEKNNIEYKLRIWDKVKGKKLIHVFNIMFPLYDESVITNDELCDFFKSYINNK